MTKQLNQTELWSLEEKLEYTKKTIMQSDNIVCLSGVGVVMECGALNFNRDDVAYRIEEEYDRCPEEIMSSVFYNVRMKQFYARPPFKCRSCYVIIISHTDNTGIRTKAF